MRVLVQYKGWDESEMHRNINDPAVWMNFISNIFTKTLLQMHPMNQRDCDKTMHFFTRLAKTPPTVMMHVLSLMEGHTDRHLLNPAFLANTVFFCNTQHFGKALAAGSTSKQ